MQSKDLYDNCGNLPKRVLYGQNNFDSVNEAKYAHFWDQLRISYIYHPAKFYVNYDIYTPDFYLPEYDLYAEVKPGIELFETDDMQQKLSSVIQNHVTSIGNGLILLTPLSFHKSDDKKCCFYGSWLRWDDDLCNIKEGIWVLGVFKEEGLMIKAYDLKKDYLSCYPSLPSPLLATSAEYGRPYCAYCIYEAVRKTIYMSKNDFIYLNDNDEENGD